jgi:hypothetical protein
MPQIVARVIIDLDDVQAELAESGSNEVTFHANSPGLTNAVAFSASELEETERNHLLL